MRHANGGYKLGRSTAHRRALLRNLSASVIEKNRIVTTLAKARAVQPVVERMVTLGKVGSLAAKRRAFAFLFTRKSVQVLFDEVAPRFMDRAGDYDAVFLFAAFTALCVGLLRIFTRRGFVTAGSAGRTLEMPVLAVAPAKAQ